ncbi:hypothetical protein MMC24_001021 [Lignoscripta atroalba]|nr:hypothetical protein [Lignoscripta atroalba]
MVVLAPTTLTSSSLQDVPRTTLLTLPAEVRLMIYKLLLVNHSTKTLSIRNEDPSLFELRKREQRLRSSYRIMSDRFRTRSIETTYCLKENPGVFPSILGVNRQLHGEASHVLYSEHVFDFDGDVESVVPFLSDLTPAALSSIKRINIVKRALPYLKDFDRCEWRRACAFISEKMSLVQLSLGILGGKPAAQWEVKETYEKSHFGVISNFEGMEWVRQLAAIKGLQELDVKAYLQHCPPPSSNAMAFFINFSASIETGLAEYLREHMLAQAA